MGLQSVKGKNVKGKKQKWEEGGLQQPPFRRRGLNKVSLKLSLVCNLIQRGV